MAKQCTKDGCSNPVFSKKLCQQHWRMEYAKPIKSKTPIAVSDKPIRQQSAKQVSLAKQLSLVKEKVRLTAVQNNEYYCKGCGRSGITLDCSHNLSIKDYKHLELDPSNIILLCRLDHARWESKVYAEMVKLLCFEECMKYVLKHAPDLYNRIMNQKQHYEYFKQ